MAGGSSLALVIKVSKGTALWSDKRAKTIYKELTAVLSHASICTALTVQI